VANPNKRKGDRAERELATLLSDLLGRPMRRMLGAGRQDDVGDIDGIDDLAIQAKHWNDITAAITQGITQLAQQQKNKNADHGVLFIKHRKHGWLEYEQQRTEHTRLGVTLRETRLPSSADQTTRETTTDSGVARRSDN
jgi:Holliday junction resolvase